MNIKELKLGQALVGCKEFKKSVWLEKFEKIGAENNYTADEIAAYGAFIRLVSKK